MPSLRSSLLSSWRQLALATSAFVVVAADAGAQSRTDDEAVSLMISRAYPEADSTRRIVRDVGVAARKVIEQRLPFKVHFNELGEHTLFVAFRSRRPVGVIYIRAEETEWGLVDVAWALTLDLRVHGFQFLGGRGDDRERLIASPFARLLVGRDYLRIIQLLNARGHVEDVAAPTGTEALANIVVRSAAKALVVADTVWRDQVEKLQDTAIGFDAFPSAARFPCQTGQFELRIGDEHQVVQVKIVNARTNSGFHLGSVLLTETELHGKTVQLSWVVDGDLLVRRVEPPTLSEDKELRLACRNIEGQPLHSPTDDSNPLVPLAKGLAALIRIKAGGE